MTFDEILTILVTSSPDDWYRVPEVREADSFVGGLDIWTSGKEAQLGMALRGHYDRATYKPDVSLGLAWGLDPEPGQAFTEGWFEIYPNPRATRLYVDVLWNSMLIERRLFISVDGGRAKIPIPDRPIVDRIAVGYSMTEAAFNFGRLLAGIDDGRGDVRRYQDYVQRAGIIIAG